MDWIDTKKPSIYVTSNRVESTGKEKTGRPKNPWNKESRNKTQKKYYSNWLLTHNIGAPRLMEDKQKA